MIVIAIDGPSGAGKGTLGKQLAAYFDFAFLDTGLIYRALGKKCFSSHLDFQDVDSILSLAHSLKPDDLKAPGLKTEKVAHYASKASSIPQVRQALLEFQKSFADSPPDGKKGAVLDGRDIGTTICPHAIAKIYVTASLETRAQRRYKELQERGIKVIYEAILQELEKRDARDLSRKASPLKPAKDAYILDTTDLNCEEVFEASKSYIFSKAPALLDKHRVLKGQSTTKN